MDKNVFCFGVASRFQTMPFTFINTVSALPTQTEKRPRVDSVSALVHKVKSAVASEVDVELDLFEISDDEVVSDETSEFTIIDSKVIEGRSFKINGFRYVSKTKTIKRNNGETKTYEKWFKYECEGKGEDDEDLKPMPKSKRAKKLVNLPSEKVIITFTPPGSPTSEKGEDESYFESMPAANAEQASAPAPSPVQAMVSPLLRLLAAKNPDKALIRAAEDILINHLHDTAVTLSDIEAILPPNLWDPRTQRPITPSLALHHRVTGKLAANIGLNVSRGLISADELEAIKTHIHRTGDDKDWLFHRVIEQVARFKAESEAFTLAKLTEKQKKQRAHQDRQLAQQQEKAQKIKANKAEKELRHFLAAVPKEWHVPFPSGHSPYQSMVDNFIADHGFARDKIPRKVRPSRAWIDPLGEGSFAMTRLRNGPGVNDKGKEPHVCIPEMKRKLPRRKVLVNDADEVLWAQVQMMSPFDIDSTAGARRAAVVRLPPH